MKSSHLMRQAKAETHTTYSISGPAVRTAVVYALRKALMEQELVG